MSGNVTIYYPSSEGYEDAQEAYDAMNFYFDETGCTEDVGEECSSGDVTISPGDYVTSNPSSLGQTDYLKHTVVNNIVTAVAILPYRKFCSHTVF